MVYWNHLLDQPYVISQPFAGPPLCNTVIIWRNPHYRWLRHMCTTPIDNFFNLEETVMMTRWLQQRGLIRQFPQPADKRLNWHHLPTNQPPQANPRNTLLLNQVPSGWGDQRSTYDIEDNKTQKIIVWPECQPSQRLLSTFVLARNCHGECSITLMIID